MDRARLDANDLHQAPWRDEFGGPVSPAGQIEAGESRSADVHSSFAEVGVLGVGAIAEAIVTGLCRPPAESAPTIVLTPRNSHRAAALANRYPSVSVAASNQEVVDQASVVLMCLRPQDAERVLTDLRFRPDQAVVSAAANLKVSTLANFIRPGRVAARTIPLPAVSVRQGITTISPTRPLERVAFRSTRGCPTARGGIAPRRPLHGHGDRRRIFHLSPDNRHVARREGTSRI